jgi:hypothetical protein
VISVYYFHVVVELSLLAISDRAAHAPFAYVRVFVHILLLCRLTTKKSLSFFNVQCLLYMYHLIAGLEG